jgi:hypothetical protein
MSRRWPVLLIVLVAVAGVAGCLGDDGSSTDAGTSSTQSSETNADTDQPADEDSTSSDEPEREFEQRSDEATGDVAGAGANGCGINLVPLSDQPASFEVPENTTKLAVNLTLEGTGEACVSLYNATQTAGEDEPVGQMTTSDQKAQWSQTLPSAGEWTAYIYGAGTGPTDATYTFDLGYRVQLSGPPVESSS